MILLKNDCEKGAGVDLADKYDVKVYPTFALVNDQGEVTARWAGYAGVEGFVAQVDRARSDMSTIDEKSANFRADPSYDLAMVLGQHSESVFASAAAVDYYRKAMALDPTKAGELRDKIFMSMFYGMRSGEFAGHQLLAEGDAILNDPDSNVESVLMVASVARSVAPEEDYVPILRRALAATAQMDDPEALAFRQELLVDEALLIDQDKPRALTLKRETMADGWQTDAVMLNSFAWWCFENEVDLDEAYKLALKGASLSTEDKEKANILDTAAEIAFKLGKVDEAVEHETEAVRLNPENEAFKETLARFEAGPGT